VIVADDHLDAELLETFGVVRVTGAHDVGWPSPFKLIQSS